MGSPLELGRGITSPGDNEKVMNLVFAGFRSSFQVSAQSESRLISALTLSVMSDRGS